MGEGTEHCVAPFLKCLVMEGLPLYSVFACRGRKNLQVIFLSWGACIVLRIF